MKVLQAIVVAALIILTVHRLATLGNQHLQKNRVLVCLVRDLRQEPSLTNSECWIDEKPAMNNFSSLTIESLKQRRLLLNKSQESVFQDVQDLCLIQLPQPWNDLSFREDPRARQITYYKVLASRQHGMGIANINRCARLLPSSTYLHFISKGYTWLADEGLSSLTKEIAYQADHGWTRPLWRALNALEQGDDYLESGNIDLAYIAYTRTLKSLLDEDHKDKDFYLSLAYRGLAEAAEKNGDLHESVEYYQLGIKTSKQLRPELTPAYVKILFEDDRNEATSRLISFIADNNIGTPEYIFSVTLALVELSELDNADKLLEIFKLSDSPYWLAAKGVTARAKGELATAASFFESAIEAGETLDPSTLASWASRLAVTYILQENFENGIEAQKLATLLRPDSSLYWHDLAWFYQMDNQIDLALEAINKALELAPENSAFQDLKNQIVAQQNSFPS